jgi:hypothetical protein
VATGPSTGVPAEEGDPVEVSPAFVPILALIQRLPLDPGD